MIPDSDFDFSLLKRKNRLSGTASELSPEVASTLGAFLGNYLGGEEAVVVSARDFRKDTRMISRAFNAGLISVGTTVFELHATSLPVIQFALRRFSAHAGVHFASAHRSSEKINARIFDQTGIEIPFSEIFAQDRINRNLIKRALPEKIADILSVKQANDLYRAAISSALSTDVLREQNYSVVVDCALGPIAEVFPNILAEMGCKVLTLNAYKPEGIPESLPSAESLSILARTVIAAKADLGIAFDPGGSRAIFLDEHGKIIDTHIVVSILLQDKMIGRDKGHVVLSNTLWILDNWMKENNVTATYNSDYPGEISRSMQFHRALFGANEQGYYIHPTMSNDSEPFVSTILLLSSFARDERHKYISTFAEEKDVLNKDYVEERSFSLVSEPELFFKKIYESDKEHRIVNTLNGLKLIRGERKWCHIFSTIISYKLTLRACAESKEDREEIMQETIELVETTDSEIA